MRRAHVLSWLLAPALGAFLAAPGLAAGTLTPLGSDDQPVQILDHHVEVAITNGFSRTEVTQTFFNPNDRDVEALYAFPLPKSASLSELEVRSGEVTIEGEVVERERAQQVYDAEKAAGREAALSRQEEQRRFEFLISPVRAQSQVLARFVYYQPLEVDTGVGRYVYPLQDGGTDERAKAFWYAEEKVQGRFTLDLELVSVWPVESVRTNREQSVTVMDRLDEGRWTLSLVEEQAVLASDFVFYYRLADGLPGRVELLTYRDDPNEPGTFQLVLTPGVDLGEIQGGVDYSFVVDVSGSMNGEKIADLAEALQQTIGELDGEDRFRIVAFADSARRLHRGWIQADEAGVAEGVRLARGLRSGGGTNLYDGLELGLADLDADRPTNLILITDADTNTGVVDPKEFHALMSQVDVRVFGFLLGNGGNWPLLETITGASGGYATWVSTGDDLAGQILLAASKVTHEALHGVAIELTGVDARDLTGDLVSKIYHGQQVVIFGRYETPGTGYLDLTARQTGEDRQYRTWIEFPELDTSHPELERLWALARIDMLQRQRDAGLLDPAEVDSTILDLALDAQLVTEVTSMIALREEAFAEHGIERRNRDRVERERVAQSERATTRPALGQRADAAQPMFDRPAPSAGRGSGAFDVWALLLVAALAVPAAAALRRER
jgi:Ca-activated chloride channel family protein